MLGHDGQLTLGFSKDRRAPPTAPKVWDNKMMSIRTPPSRGCPHPHPPPVPSFPSTPCRHSTPRRPALPSLLAPPFPPPFYALQYVMPSPTNPERPPSPVPHNPRTPLTLHPFPCRRSISRSPLPPLPSATLSTPGPSSSAGWGIPLGGGPSGSTATSARGSRGSHKRCAPPPRDSSPTPSVFRGGPGLTQEVRPSSSPRYSRPNPGRPAYPLDIPNGGFQGSRSRCALVPPCSMPSPPPHPPVSPPRLTSTPILSRGLPSFPS